jgi:ABC-2 type transport system permease protein
LKRRSYFNVSSEFQSKKKPIYKCKRKYRCHSRNPIHFERNLIKQKNTNLSVSINAIDGAAGVSNVYITQIISSFNQSIQTQLQTYNDGNATQPENIMTIPSFFWYNKTLNYKPS